MNQEVTRTRVRAVTKTQLRRSLTLFEILLERRLGLMFVRENLAFSLEPVQALNEPGSTTVTTSFFVTAEWYEILALLKTHDSVVVANRSVPFVVLRPIPVATVEIDRTSISVFSSKGKPTVLESASEEGWNEIPDVTPHTHVHITGATTAAAEQICRVLNVIEQDLHCKIRIAGQTCSIEIEPYHDDNWAAESEKPSTFLIRVVCNARGELTHLTLGRCLMVSNQKTGFTDEHLEQAIRKALVGR